MQRPLPPRGMCRHPLAPELPRRQEAGVPKAPEEEEEEAYGRLLAQAAAERGAHRMAVLCCPEICWAAIECVSTYDDRYLVLRRTSQRMRSLFIQVRNMSAATSMCVYVCVE